MNLTRIDLRHQAISASLFKPTSLSQAVEQLGFVQADPIRSPARAQDLILRHRVENYRVGDLEQNYSSILLEEDFLYAYGFMPLSTWQLLHPRHERELSSDEQRVLAIVASQKRIHPRELEAHLGAGRERNDWGGFSKTTTRTLQSLHYHGALRVAERANGIRLYALANRQHEPMEPSERLRQLVLLIANLLGPLSDRSLRAVVQHLSRGAPTLEGRQSSVKKLIESGELAYAVVDSIRYVWPGWWAIDNRPNETVRFLAPFDPLSWDRARFEHFWDWLYRFEAYTPPAKRQLGYYAMPMLWRDDIIGWVNISNQNGNFFVEPGFKKDVSNDQDFDREYEAEVERFRLFLQKR
ncbi:winged helix-turn-helix domain-containing protein [Spirosoma sp. KCTC 42546]|uniref:DNA glycosylase AlkZ-like family protein n=1 Tax=Spirosoma sp. KCTC 42546 TaxID=2520506 RepID=UPI0011590E76|nr:crosslink repair DNA glycosylase YcaQ family protein [Spirosoma sp. KCTC 42546]QDK80625.1 winged helix-turn-helix domain-containing protein [Spirosoma sp. KCTC 42546]